MNTKCKYCGKIHENYNTGCLNSGYRNSGYYNSGDRNSGGYNSGGYNSGYYNSGYRNSGYYNSGHRNSGDHNSGYYNSGDYNSGDYNSGDYNSGWFNSNEPKMRFFNKDSSIKYSEFIEGKIVYPDLKVCDWIDESKMSDEEKKNNSDYKVVGGYLKTLSYKDAWAEYWARASVEDKKWFTTLPNFSEDIFEEITGIKVNAEVSLKGKEVEVKVDGKTFRAIIQ